MRHFDEASSREIVKANKPLRQLIENQRALYASQLGKIDTSNDDNFLRTKEAFLIVKVSNAVLGFLYDGKVAIGCLTSDPYAKDFYDRYGYQIFFKDNRSEYMRTVSTDNLNRAERTDSHRNSIFQDFIYLYDEFIDRNGSDFSLRGA